MSRGQFHDTAFGAVGRVPAARTDPDEHGPRIWQDTVYGRARRFYLRPDEHTMPLLARRIADTWLEICPEIRGSVGEVHGAVRGFLRDLDAQLRDTRRDNDFDLPDLRRRHLDAWEAGLLAAQRESRTDTSYRRAVFLFALLRRINDDCPGLLHVEVVARLERETRLSHVRRDGELELPPGETDRIHAIARGVVKQALAERRGTNGRSAPAVDVVIALHVLLSLGTGEPPEVLRRLAIGDIIATAVPGRDDGLQCLAPTERLAALVQRRAVRSYCVRYLKNRSSERYQQVYTRADGRVFAALSALITLTAWRFGDEAWDLTPLITRTNLPERRMNFATIPGRWALTIRELLMVLAQPDHPLVVEAGIVRRGRPAPVPTLINNFTRLRTIAHWSDNRGLPGPASWSQIDANLLLAALRDGSYRPDGEPVSPDTVRGYVLPLKLLRHFAPVLTGGGFTFQPWGARSSTNVAEVVAPVENKTPPLSWDTWAPAVAAAWTIVDRFSADILAAAQAAASRHTRRSGGANSWEVLQAWAAQGGLVPLQTGYGRGQPKRGEPNRRQLCRQLGISNNIFNAATRPAGPTPRR